jgi:hypothetical protein
MEKMELIIYFAVLPHNQKLGIQVVKSDINKVKHKIPKPVKNAEMRTIVKKSIKEALDDFFDIEFKNPNPKFRKNLPVRIT